MSILFTLIGPNKVRPHVYIATENVTFVVEERVNLVCKIEKRGVFIAAKWIREQTEQTLETANFSSDANSKFYHQFYYEIKKVSTKDKGIYKCVANFSGYGPVEAWYNLRVKGKCCCNCIFSVEDQATFLLYVALFCLPFVRCQAKAVSCSSRRETKRSTPRPHLLFSEPFELPLLPRSG